MVALLAEGVDRNFETEAPDSYGRPVALLAEGVDRNIYCVLYRLSAAVALLAEDVDRNFIKPMRYAAEMASPSSRRAWIEI